MPKNNKIKTIALLHPLLIFIFFNLWLILSKLTYGDLVNLNILDSWEGYIKFKAYNIFLQQWMQTGWLIIVLIYLYDEIDKSADILLKKSLNFYIFILVSSFFTLPNAHILFGSNSITDSFIFVALSTTLSFITLFLSMYILYACARTLVSYEINRTPVAKEIFSTFFQFMFFPICIFWLHKRLNAVKT